MATDSGGTKRMVHSSQRNGLSSQTQEMLLVHAGLYVRRWGMDLCGNDSTRIIHYKSNGTKSQIYQEGATASKKTLGIHDSPAEEMKSTSSTSNREPQPGQIE